MESPASCTRSGCKTPATVILERNGRAYCRPCGLALALATPLVRRQGRLERIPRSRIIPLAEWREKGRERPQTPGSAEERGTLWG